jgi:two-component system nitrogen regulation response regulator GlnG
MMHAARQVLVVDDEESICWGLERLLSEEGHDVRVASSAEAALDAARERRPDLVVMDIRLPGMDGLAAMERLSALVGPVPIIVMTAFGNLTTAVAAVKNGAFDYLTKPFDLEQMAAVVERALGHRQELRPSSSETNVSDELLGVSPQMQRVFKQIALVAPADVSVLITGESGTGKELVARAIHRNSSRADRPFVAVNLASFSPTLIESELFGHVRGAFTGADAARPGLLELADGATVFFDEIGDVPASVQVKLLRVLEQRQLTPVGDTQSRLSDFRVIAATNRNLAAGIHELSFRHDLYFRLAGVEISLAPLRERVDDIPLLAEHFLRHARVPNNASLRFAEATVAELCRRPWVGNARELRSAVEHAAMLARAGAIGVEHLPPAMTVHSANEVDLASTVRGAVETWVADELSRGCDSRNLYDRLLEVIEPPLLKGVMNHTNQNRVAAAEILGIHRATLRKKLNE